MNTERKKKMVRGSIFLVMLAIYITSGYAFTGGVSVGLFENSEVVLLQYLLISSFNIIISLILLNETLILIFRRRKTIWESEIRVFTLFIYGFCSLLLVSGPLMRLAAEDLSPAIKWGILGASPNYSLEELISMALFYLIVRYIIKREETEEKKTN